MRLFFSLWLAGLLLLCCPFSSLNSQNWKPSQVKRNHDFFAGKWIPVSEIVTTDSLQAKLGFDWPIFNHAGAGMYFIPGYARLYQTFLRMPLGKKDTPVMIAEGGLTYYPQEKVFRIGPEDCLLGDATWGNIVTYTPESGQLSAQGIFDLPVNFGKDGPRMETAGTWTQTGGPVQIETQLVTAFYLPQLHDKAWERLSHLFQLHTATNETVDLKDPVTLNALAAVVDKGQKEPVPSLALRESIEVAERPSEIVLPAKWEPELVFADLNWKYNNDHRSLWANGDIGLVAMKGEVINREVSTRMEYRYGQFSEYAVRATDTLTLYLEADELNWVLLRYFEDQLMISSSDDEKPPKGDSFVQYAKRSKCTRKETCQIVKEETKDQFLARFTRRYIWMEE